MALPGLPILSGTLQIIMAAITFTPPGPPGIPIRGENDIQVSCYLNADEGSFLGSLMTFAPETAGQACNKIYYACKGKCFGCFSDNDLSEEICYDHQGRRFLK